MNKQPIEFENYKFDQTFLNKFNLETERANSFSFTEFSNKKIFNGFSIIDSLLNLEKQVEHKRVPKNINKRITLKTGINLVLEFYERLDLKTNVEDIILNKNDMFNTKIDRTITQSSVGHHDENPKIDFNVGYDGSLESISTIAHESAHAICGHYTELAKLLKEQNEIIAKFGNPSNELDNFKKSKFNIFMIKQNTLNHDCIGEIETHIIEKLFMKFLVEKNTITEDDQEIFLQNLNNSFRLNLRLIFEENTIYSEILKIKKSNNNKDDNLTETEFEELYKSLSQKHHFNDLMHKLKFIAERTSNDFSRYRFRYVVAEVVSTVWINKYENATKQEKAEMLLKLKEYILKSHMFDINTVIPHLIENATLESVINDFVQIHQTNLNNNNQQTP